MFNNALEFCTDYVPERCNPFYLRLNDAAASEDFDRITPRQMTVSRDFTIMTHADIAYELVDAVSDKLRRAIANGLNLEVLAQMKPSMVPIAENVHVFPKNIICQLDYVPVVNLLLAYDYLSAELVQMN